MARKKEQKKRGLDNRITVQAVSFVERKLESRLPGLKSRAGRVHGSKWQKQIAAAVIFGDGEWTLKSTSCTFARSSYRSLWINNKQHTGEPRYNYPLWSTSLVSTMWIKINTLSGAMAFMFSLCSCKLVSRGGGGSGSGGWGRRTKVVWKYQLSHCTIIKLLRESRKGKVSVD